MHIPVLLNETLEILGPKPGELCVDGTLGEGGHALEVINKISPGGIFVGIDRDPDSISAFQKKVENLIGKDKLEINLILANDNFMNMEKILKNKKLNKADCVLLDLGFSSRQLEVGRGFSFLKDEPLLMTYKKDATPLKEVLKNLSEEEIFNIIKNYGEERYAKRIARAIFEREKNKPVETSGELAELIKNSVPRNYERGRIHPATRTFLAFRIYTNQELESLEKFLDSLEAILSPGARVGVISFNSLEDRIIKHTFRLLAKRNILKILTKKPIRPSLEEIKNNPRSRSAKLRAAIKV